LFIYEKERKLLVLDRINHQCKNWINIELCSYYKLANLQYMYYWFPLCFSACM